MKVTKSAICAICAGLVACVQSSAIYHEIATDTVESLVLAGRALPNSPQGYTPSQVDCPSTPPTVRAASSLSQNETAWLQLRRNATIQPMREFLTRMNISGFDAGSYIDQHSSNVSALPNIGVAFSGGGWRALLNGAGVLKAMDSRSNNSTAQGHIGGLLQSATYVAGLSGGNWLVGSIFQNNFTTVEALVDNGKVWQFGNSVLEGPPSSGLSVLNAAQYWIQLENVVSGKDDAGFDISITDYWGRALSYQLINADEGGPAYTWSSLALTDGFKNASQPFPIVVADARMPGQQVVSINSSVYEFNPFEMGTWDVSTYGFVPTQYLGTNFTSGQVTSGDQCVVGFDNAGFIMGTSSSIFNSIISDVASTDSDIPSILQTGLEDILKSIGNDNDDIAEYRPNPFYQWNPTTHNYNVNATSLTLVDGGEDGQNIPLSPLIQPMRHVDVIFANDNSADTTYSWPNGTSLVATYERSQVAITNGTAFPSIPDTNTFINLGLNTRPTFFGCNASNITIPGGARASYSGVNVPLVVYLPNYPYTTFSNQSTVSLTTNNTYRDALISNGYDVATMGNGSATAGSDWNTCIACAVLSRSFTRTGTAVPAACVKCFQEHCWNGTLAPQTPKPYSPTPGAQTATKAGVTASGAGRVVLSVGMSVVGLLFAILTI